MDPRFKPSFSGSIPCCMSWRCRAWFACFFEAANRPAEQMNGMNGMQQPQQPMCLSLLQFWRLAGCSICITGGPGNMTVLLVDERWFFYGFLHMLPQCHDVILSYCTEFWLATTENMWHKKLLSAYLNIERFYSRLISTIETDLLKSTSGFCRWNSFWIICSRKKTP